MNFIIKPMVSACAILFLLGLTACAKESIMKLNRDRYEDALARGTPILTTYTSPWDAREGGGYNCTPNMTHAVMPTEWTSNYFNTDSEYGGCLFQFFIRDTAGDIELVPLALSVDFQPMPGANPQECRNTGRHSIPIRPGREYPGIPFMILDTDNTRGGCNLTFIVENRDDIGLDIKFYPNDTGVEQCVNRTQVGKWHTARLNNPVTIGLDLDNRYGGCVLELRLRKLS